MFVKALAATSPDVAGDIQLQRNLSLRQHLQQLRIMLSRKSMPNPLRPDVDRRPDALRPDRLARMSRQPQPGSLRLRVRLLENIRTPPRLIPTDANPDDARIKLPQLSRLTKHLLAPHPSTLDRLGVRFNLLVLPEIDNPERDIHLGMQHPLGRQVANHVVSNQLIV